MATDEEKLRYAEKHYGVKEKDIEEKAYAYARSRGVWHTKFKSANNRGLPDRIFIAPGNIVFFIEFKRPKKTARAQQKLVIDEMTDLGAKVFVTNDLDRAKQIIDDMVMFGDAV
jgi:hypothetical protein